MEVVETVVLEPYKGSGIVVVDVVAVVDDDIAAAAVDAADDDIAAVAGDDIVVVADCSLHRVLHLRSIFSCDFFLQFSQLHHRSILPYEEVVRYRSSS